MELMVSAAVEKQDEPAAEKQAELEAENRHFVVSAVSFDRLTSQNCHRKAFQKNCRS